ncbi:MAG: HAD-IA family hydrolase [Bacteroidota bacterium]|nr:HAD-IA family hydrolase [Bacteroidota bacterium]
MILKGVKNIIFDFGGIIIDIDYSAVKQAFIDVGMRDPDKFYKHDSHAKIVEDFECGLVSPAKFREEIISDMVSPINYDAFDTAWNAIIKTIPRKRVELIDELSKKYRVFLLSNTNSIHYNKYTSEFRETYKRELIDLFDKAYFSFEMKLRKPDKQIFDKVLKTENLIANETLFVDDSEINIEAAKSVGLKVLYKPQKEELTDFF